MSLTPLLNMEKEVPLNVLHTSKILLLIVLMNYHSTVQMVPEFIKLVLLTVTLSPLQINNILSVKLMNGFLKLQPMVLVNVTNVS